MPVPGSGVMLARAALPNGVSSGAAGIGRAARRGVAGGAIAGDGEVAAARDLVSRPGGRPPPAPRRRPAAVKHQGDRGKRSCDRAGASQLHQRAGILQVLARRWHRPPNKRAPRPCPVGL